METSQRGFDACFQLLQAGDADGLRRLLEQDPASSEARDSTGVNLLMHSIYPRRPDLADLIAAQKRDSSMVELLLKHHADPKLTNDAGKTSAMVAREKGHEEIATLLEE